MAPVSRYSHESEPLGSVQQADYRESADRQLVREWGLRAGLQLEEGHIRDAELTLRLALAKIPGDRRCRSLLAICLAAERGKLATAEKLARGVVAQDPDDAVAHYALGRVLLQTGARRQAFRAFARARTLAAGDAALCSSVGRQDPRGAPVIPGLSRDHALNVVLGRLLRRLGPGRRPS